MKKIIYGGLLGMFLAVMLVFVLNAVAVNAVRDADFNNDGCVTQEDVDIAKSNSGKENPSFEDGDADGNGQVNSTDISIAKSQLEDCEDNDSNGGGSRQKKSGHHEMIEVRPGEFIQAKYYVPPTTSTLPVATSTPTSVRLSDIPYTGGFEGN